MPQATSTASLTVVLVHGAFADSSSWNGVVERLLDDGIHVTAPPNPLRGISHDSAYVASFIEQVPGPVLAVGHSYGGAVISNAAAALDNPDHVAIVIHNYRWRIGLGEGEPQYDTLERRLAAAPVIDVTTR